MQNTPVLYVQAAPGLKLPKEGDPRSYITDVRAEPVASTHYYRKAIVDGDLVQVAEGEFKKQSAAAAKAPAPAAD